MSEKVPVTPQAPKPLPRAVWIGGGIVAALVLVLVLAACIGFPFCIGTGFLLYDRQQYSDKDLPKVPKLTGAPPGAPVVPPKVDSAKEEKKAEEKKSE